MVRSDITRPLQQVRNDREERCGNGCYKCLKRRHDYFESKLNGTSCCGRLCAAFTLFLAGWIMAGLLVALWVYLGATSLPWYILANGLTLAAAAVTSCSFFSECDADGHDSSSDCRSGDKRAWYWVASTVAVLQIAILLTWFMANLNYFCPPETEWSRFPKNWSEFLGNWAQSTVPWILLSSGMVYFAVINLKNTHILGPGIESSLLIEEWEWARGFGTCTTVVFALGAFLVCCAAPVDSDDHTAYVPLYMPHVRHSLHDFGASLVLAGPGILLILQGIRKASHASKVILHLCTSFIVFVITRTLYVAVVSLPESGLPIIAPDGYPRQVLAHQILLSMIEAEGSTYVGTWMFLLLTRGVPVEMVLGIYKVFVYSIYLILMSRADNELDRENLYYYYQRNSLNSFMCHLEYVCGEWSLFAFLFFLKKAPGVNKKVLGSLWMFVSVSLVILNMSMIKIWLFQHWDVHDSSLISFRYFFDGTSVSSQRRHHDAYLNQYEFIPVGHPRRCPHAGLWPSRFWDPTTTQAP